MPKADVANQHISNLRGWLDWGMIFHALRHLVGIDGSLPVGGPDKMSARPKLDGSVR